MSETSIHEEGGAERIPTQEEVMEIITAEIGGHESETTRALSDEKGLYRLEVVAEDKETNEKTEYLYVRKGEFGESASASTTIYVVFYKGDMPCGGSNIAGFDENSGTWEKAQSRSKNSKK